MHIALCTPVSIDMFDTYVEHHEPLPKGYTYPLAFYLAIKFVERGHRVTVITSAFDVPELKTWSSPDRLLKVVATPRRRPRFSCLDAYRKEVTAMRLALLEAKPDLVHAQWTYEFADAGLSSGLKCLVTARDAPWLVAWYFRQFYRLYRAVYASLWVVPRITWMTTVSEHIKRVFSKEPFFKPDRLWVVPNGLEKRFFVEQSKQGVKDPSSPLFFSISGWNRLKNLPTLLRAFKEVRQTIPRARLVVLSAPQGQGGRLEQQIKKQHLLEGVELKGSLPHKEMLAFLAREVDVVIHTTREESFSMAVLEAMANGIPVVGGVRSGAVPWLLDDGKAGCVVDIRHPGAIAGAMKRLVEDQTLYAQLAAAGLARARENFTMDGVVDKYLAIYGELVNRQARRPGSRE